LALLASTALDSRQRINLLGWLDGRVVQLIYTEREEDLHVISLREATKGNNDLDSPRLPW